MLDLRQLDALLESPHADWQVRYFEVTPNPVGASLLAIGPCQSTLLLNDTPLSRAGSLPQGFM